MATRALSGKTIDHDDGDHSCDEDGEDVRPQGSDDETELAGAAAAACTQIVYQSPPRRKRGSQPSATAIVCLRIRLWPRCLQAAAVAVPVLTGFDEARPRYQTRIPGRHLRSTSWPWPSNSGAAIDPSRCGAQPSGLAENGHASNAPLLRFEAWGLKAIHRTVFIFKLPMAKAGASGCVIMLLPSSPTADSLTPSPRGSTLTGTRRNDAHICNTRVRLEA